MKYVLLCLAVVSLNTTALADVQGTWISDPYLPGPSQPPVGRSLFDYLFTKTDNGKAAYAIPFPFSRLVERIEQQLPEASASGKNGIQQVLIPMGRSLVRNASHDHFTNPRLVLAVDAPPRFDPTQAGLLLKDRLYIGYMESARLLEVISYNEAAGRFEFQLVEGYGPDSQPKVRYANRQLCIACHQNAAPLFSRQQWDETNANPEIDKLLIQQSAARYGVPEGAGVDIPFAIDAATDRANYYTYYQLMWQQACVPDPENNAANDQVAVRCRTALLRAVLQYALSDGAGFDQDGVEYQQHFRRVVQANVAQRWPESVWIPDPDIPNRNPLLRHRSYQKSGEASVLPSANVIGEDFDPLVLRPPLKRLDAGSERSLQLLVSGLAGFIADTDRKRLDDYLFNAAIEKRLIKQQALSCVLQKKARTKNGERFAFDCRSESEAGAGLVNALKGRFTLEKDGVTQATVNDLSMASGVELRNLVLRHKADEAGSGSVRFRLFNGGLHARLPNGHALGELVLEWPKVVVDSITVSARVSMLSDFTLIDNALSKLEQQAADNHTDALSAMPFRRASLMPALFEALNMEKLEWCCIDPRAMPAAITEATSYQDAADLEPFYQYCASCHARESAFPANFLYGDEAGVRQQLSHCAERIYYRLSMAHKQAGNRDKTPMPPLQTLEAMGQSAVAWASSSALNTLKKHVGNLLQQQGVGGPDMEQYERRGFDQLRTCLPAS